MEERRPLVSVIMPAYNSADFIAEAIKSVIKQTYGHWELIVVDDGSGDNTVEVARSYESFDSRIKVYQLSSNSGRPATTRNNGLRRAKGELVAFLDADDVWFSEKLIRQVEFFEKNHDHALVFGKFDVKSNDPRYDGKNIAPSEGVDWSQSVYERLLKYDFIACSSVMIKLSSMLKDEKFFDENPDLAFVEDWDLWLRISRNSKIGYISQSVGYYRMHGKNCSWDDRLERAVAVIQKHQQKGFVNEYEADRAMANIYFSVAWSIVDQEVSKARKLFFEGRILSKKFSKIYWMNFLGQCLAMLPFLCRWLKKNSIDRKIGKLIINHQNL